MRLAVIMLFSIFALTSHVTAEPVKLNGPLVPGGDVSSAGLRFSPDGSQVLYFADQDSNDVFEIFLVPSSGGAPLQLNAPLVNNGDVFAMHLSAGGNRVLYLADQETDGIVEIYSVSTTNGTPEKLNSLLGLDQDVLVEGAQFSPDGSRVLYLADQTVNDRVELYSVPSIGGTPIKLNGTSAVGGDVFSTGLQFSPDSSRVIYLADQDTNDVSELYSVSSTGGTPTKLNGVLATGGDVSSILFSPAGDQVLYLADQDTNDIDELFIVASTGGTPVKLNSTLAADRDVFSGGLQFSPDGSWVIYLADQEENDTVELYSVASSGGTPTKLNGPLSVGGDVFDESLQVTSDGSQVFYVADQEANDRSELFRVPIAGGLAEKVNSPLVAGGDVEPDSIRLSPDGSLVLYIADQDVNDSNELYSVSTTGGTPVKLNAPLASGGDVFTSDLQFSPTGDRVVYSADQDANNVNEIYIVPSTGGTPVKLNAPLILGGDVFEVQFSPNGSRVIYLADQDTDNTGELYSRAVRLQFAAGGGDWDTATNWDQGVTPDAVTEVRIGDSAHATVSGGVTERTVNLLEIGDGLGSGSVNLIDGATIRSLHGVSIATGGVLAGDGRIIGALVNHNGGEIRVGGGERLLFTGASVANAGRIEAIGSTFDPAELEFTSAVTNAAETGLVVARNAKLRFDGGLSNAGSLAVSFGTSDIFGDITNESTGSIVVTGGGQATFFDDVANQGTFQTGSQTTVVFLGSVTGSGDFLGAGTLLFEGDLRPGNSAAAVSIRSDLQLGGLADLEIELGGLEQGTEYDTLSIEGSATLAGALNVSLIGGFNPDLGNSFEILRADAGILGAFDTVIYPELASGLEWLLDYDVANDRLLLEVISALDADFDRSGSVNDADLMLWENRYGLDSGADADSDGDSDGNDFLAWQRQFSGTANAIFEASVSVPEPASLMLLLLAIFCPRNCLLGRRPLQLRKIRKL